MSKPFEINSKLSFPSGDTVLSLSCSVYNEPDQCHAGSFSSGEATSKLGAHRYTGCIKKKVIELQRAIVSELLCV